MMQVCSTCKTDGELAQQGNMEDTSMTSEDVPDPARIKDKVNEVGQIAIGFAMPVQHTDNIESVTVANSRPNIQPNSHGNASTKTKFLDMYDRYDQCDH